MKRVKELKTRPQLIAHIASGVEKFLEIGESTGTIQLSLTKTRPEYITVQSRNVEGDRLYSLTYFSGGCIIYTSDWIRDGDRDALQGQVAELIDRREKVQKAELNEYALALEQTDEIIRRIQAVREVYACRNDAMILAHKRELNEHFKVITSHIDSLDTLLWEREMWAKGEDPREDGIFLTENETRTVYSVFAELLRMPYEKLNTHLGSITIEEMRDLLSEKLSDRHEREEEEVV